MQDKHKKNWGDNEGAGVSRSRELGNTHTPADVARRVVGHFTASAAPTSEFRFLEPCVGTGVFYFAMFDVLLKHGFSVSDIVTKMLHACEYDESAYKIFRSKLVERIAEHGGDASLIDSARIRLDNFITTKFDGDKFDLIATNPPYVAAKNIPSDDRVSGLVGDRKGTLAKYRSVVQAEIAAAAPDVPGSGGGLVGTGVEIDVRSDLYMYFHLRCMALLKDGGRSVFLCSDSWLDSDFGGSLKTLLVDSRSPYTLTDLISFRLHSMFRDDTGAIVTAVGRNAPKRSTRLVQSDSTIQDFSEDKENIITLEQDDLRAIFDDGRSARNRLVLFHDAFIQVDAFETEMSASGRVVPLMDAVRVETSAVSMGDLTKNEAVGTHGAGIPIFWQLQARVNREANYQHHIDPNEPGHLLFRLDESAALAAGIQVPRRKNNVYFSTIIDRYPLFFNVAAPETVHVSKYFALTPVSQQAIRAGLDILLIAFTSILAIQSMENHLKEGTRKTLRKGENGYAKEIRKDDLRHIRIPNLFDLSSEQQERLLILYRNNLKAKRIYRFHDAMSNPDYTALQRAIFEELGISARYDEVEARTLALYYRRMRNIVEIQKEGGVRKIT